MINYAGKMRRIRSHINIHIYFAPVYVAIFDQNPWWILIMLPYMAIHWRLSGLGRYPGHIRKCWAIAGMIMLRRREWKNAREALSNALLKKRVPWAWSTGARILGNNPDEYWEDDYPGDPFTLEGRTYRRQQREIRRYKERMAAYQ